MIFEFFQADFPADNASFFAVDAALIVDDLLNMSEDQLAGLGLGAPLVIPQGTSAGGNPPPQAEPAPSTDPEPPDENPSSLTARESTATSSTTQEQGWKDTTDKSAEMDMSEEEERRYMGLPRDLYYRDYKKSGLSRRDFLEQIRFRAKTFFIEVAPGLVFGDIQRRYTAVAQVVDGTPNGYYERDQFLPGTAFTLVVGAGYAPTWWFEFGFNLGLEFPTKDFVSGYEQYANLAEDWEGGHNCPEFCDLIAFSPATAITLLVEPRARFILVPSGLTKPYIVAGWATRFYDGYDSPDFTNVAFPNRSGAQTYGPVAGVGSGFDTSTRASAFVEFTYTHLIGPGIYDSGNEFIRQVPEKLEGSGSVMSFKAGFVSRF